MLRSYPLILMLLFFCSCKNDNPINSTTNPSSFGALEGTITDKYHYPIRTITNAQIYLSSETTIDSTLSDSSGKFRFSHVPSGLDTFVATANYYKSLITHVTIQSGDTSIFNVEMSLNYEYELGTVLVGFRDSTTVESVFNYFSNLGLQIKSLMGFDCQSKLPADSLSFVRQVLNSKSYLYETDYTIFVYDGVIRIVGGFRALDSAKVQDWIETEARLKIVSVPSSYRDGNVQTQEDQEVIWVRSLRNCSLIKWLDLNYRRIITPGSNNPLPPNQSLKLTENTAGDFAARENIFKGNVNICRAYALR